MLARPGGDLLSRALRRSTIGAEGLNGRVRNGIGCDSLAITTRSCKHGRCRLARRAPLWRFPCASAYLRKSCRAGLEKSEACRCARRPPAQTCEYAIKPIEQLVPVSCMRCRTSTSGLSTWWSSTALGGEPILRGASRLDAFSGYPVRT